MSKVNRALKRLDKLINSHDPGERAMVEACEIVSKTVKDAGNIKADDFRGISADTLYIFVSAGLWVLLETKPNTRGPVEMSIAENVLQRVIDEPCDCKPGTPEGDQCKAGEALTRIQLDAIRYAMGKPGTNLGAYIHEQTAARN